MTRLLLRSGPCLLALVLLAVLSAGDAWFASDDRLDPVVATCPVAGAAAAVAPAPPVARRSGHAAVPVVPAAEWIGPTGLAWSASPCRPRGPPA